jgi:hypothetical protein
LRADAALSARFATVKNLPQDWYAYVRQSAGDRESGYSFWIGVAMLLLVLNLYSPAGPTPPERLLASGIIVFAAAAIWHWLYRGHGEAEFGFLPVVMVLYALECAVPIFTLKIYSMDVFATVALPDAVVEKSLLLVLCGMAGILLGYCRCGHLRIAKALPRLGMHWRDKSVLTTMGFAFAALGVVDFFITQQLKLSPEIQAYVNRPADFFHLSIIAFFVFQLRGQLRWRYVILLWLVLIPGYAVLGTAQGVLGPAIFEGMGLLIAYATIRRRIPWAMFALGFAAFFFMQPIKGGLRSMVFYKGGWQNTEQNQFDKLEALALVGKQGLQVVQTLDPRDLLAIASERLAGIMVFATVANRTPEQVPYWHGVTYYPLLFVAIPRFLYRDKPSEVPGNVLGHQYQLLPTDDYYSSINLMQLLELYGNFGPIGVVLGSIVIGMIYRTINDLFLREGCGLGALVGGIYLFSHLADIENAASDVFGSLLLESITLMIFYFAIRFAESVVFAIRQQRELVRPTTMAQVSAIPRGAVD